MVIMRSSRPTSQKPVITTLIFLLHPRKVLATLGTVIIALTVASTLAGAAAWALDWQEGSEGYALVGLVWLGSEHNIPTTYQIVALALAGMLSFLLARNTESVASPDRWRWRLLGFIFMFLALSEGARIHETLGEVSSFKYGGSGDIERFVHGPSMFYVPAAVLLGSCLIPLLMRLHSHTRVLLISSGFLYVGAAAGLDNLALMYAEGDGKRTPFYAALVMLEELVEMAAVALYIYALLDYLGLQQSRQKQTPAPGQGSY